MKGQELTHLLEKLYDMDRQLGGNAKKVAKAKGANEYEAIKDFVIEKLFALNKKQNERDEKFKKFGNDRDNIAFGVKIRDDIADIEKLIINLDESLRRQAKNPKKYPKAELMQRSRQYENLREQLENAKAREMGGAINEDAVAVKIQTLTEQKNALMMGAGQNQNPNRQARYEMTKDEEEALARWQKNDQEMDHKLDQIIDGGSLLKDKANMINGKIDHTNKQIGTLNKEVTKTNETLTSSNRKLKALLIQYRKPNKFCLDITLFMLFLGLIGVAVNMYQKSNK